jgi:hypothetical protein
MKKYFLPVNILILFSAFSLSFTQEIPKIDPETMKIIQSRQQNNESIPSEILGLMPQGLKITEKNWMVEESSKMLLQASLSSSIGSTNLENTESYALDLKINLTAYNMNSIVGKMTADQSLDIQRQEVQNNWSNLHIENQDGSTTYFKPEKIQVPGGYILIQKIYSKAHQEGEGMVPERTEFCGFLYIEMEAGWLVAEVQAIPNTKAGMEKWLKYIASTAGKLDVKKYFK